MTQSEKNIQITFQNGILSTIDTHVHKLTTELQEIVNNQGYNKIILYFEG